ncbi:hypothetical protein GCM10022409_36650 [Hymenobacter glaciei]|uniref:histidine kinase n=1 Tax=Hymenobacter glaciei TaxID=877209 RepID=A0ABP7UM62_9BACT
MGSTSTKGHLAYDLRLTEERLVDLYDRAPCGYCSCLPDGTLVKLNQTLLGWLGYQYHELVAQKRLPDLFTLGGRIHYETHCAPLLALAGEVREISYLLRRRDGGTLPVLLSAVVQRDETDQPLVMRVTLFDITERRRYEQQLLRAKTEAEHQREQLRVQNEQLSRTNADLDAFVYTASHDLKQPINNLSGLFEELSRTATFHDPAAGQMLGLVESALGQLRDTIEGLAAVVKQQRLAETLPTEVVEMQPFAEEIIRGLASSDAEFTLDFTAVPALRMSRASLHSILVNLLSNSLHYAQPGRPPRIAVRTTRTEGTSVLSVEDNGRGIDLRRHRNELFQLFRRFHPEVPGTGVGLFLVNRLVTQAGGRIDVTSAVGEGTAFRLFLPDPLLPLAGGIA